MLVFQWNALRVGDRVAVHDDLAPDFELSEGVVRSVRTWEGAANEVGIRLEGQTSGMLRPRRHAVHLLPIDERFPCWRCDVTAVRLDPLGSPGRGMNGWEYLIVSLPDFGEPKATQGQSQAVDMLNREGAAGWEAVGMSNLADAGVAVLLKRHTVEGHEIRRGRPGRPDPGRSNA